MTVKITREQKLRLCGNTCGRICRSHFYNGYNSYGIKECWSLKSAKRVERSMQLDFWDPAWTEVVTLSCFLPEYNRNATWLREAGLEVEAQGAGK